MFQRCLTLLLLGLAGTALACRYSVRDTGFVDLGRDPWRLEAGGPAAFRQLCRQAAASVWLDANVTLAAEDGVVDPETPRWRLRGEGDRALDLPLPSPLPDTVAGVATLLDGVVASPARTRLLDLSLKSYAVLLLVEGSDPAANQAASTAVDAAVARIRSLLPGLPKPVEVPPALLRLPVDQQPAERVLLWSLGLEQRPQAEPRLAIVYGRGRVLGSSLDGPLITRTTLQERLSLIGQDCECDLDRAWLTGPVVPGRWDRSRQETAARTLGFDPDNPLVRSEVGRIVLRGEGDRQRQRPTTTVSALGYSEGSVDDLPDDPGHGAEEPAVAPGSTRTGADAPSAAATPSPGEAPSLPAGWLVLAGTLLASLLAGGWVWWRHHGGGR